MGGSQMKYGLVLLCVGLLVACGGGVEEEPPAQESSIAYKLAVIDSGGDVPKDDPLVAAFATALDRLEATCPEDRQMLAGLGIKTQQQLTNAGINESLQEVLQNLLTMAIAADGVVLECQQLFAIYGTAEAHNR